MNESRIASEPRKFKFEFDEDEILQLITGLLYQGFRNWENMHQCPCINCREVTVKNTKLLDRLNEAITDK